MMKGVELKFGSKCITFYPLTLAHIIEHGDDLKAMRVASKDESMGPERMRSLLRLFLASAQRGDKNITEADIAEVVDLSNINQVSQAIMGLSGLTKSSDDGDSDSGPM